MDNNINKELEGLSPELAKLRKSVKAPEVPKNLFHNMQQSVIQELKTEVENSPASQKEPWWRFIFKPVPSLAFATILALVAVGIFYNSSTTNEQFVEETFITDDLSDEEILAYIDSNIEDFESTSLIEITEDEDELFLDTNYDDDEVNDYLDSNFDNIDDDAFEQLF